jgi:copper homeostasis protein
MQITSAALDAFSLEVIVCSPEDAIAAQEGGANRLEIATNLEVGGLTPPAEVVRDIIAAVRLPVRVMLRPADSFVATKESERRQICLSARDMSRLGVEGLVCGFVRDGRLDDELLTEIFRSAPLAKITFHRAFEVFSDPLAAIASLKKMSRVDRILTSGGDGDWNEKIDYFVGCVEAAAPELVIMAGGGLNQSSIELLRRKTPVREFHVGRCVRSGATMRGQVEPELVRQVAACVGRR